MPRERPAKVKAHVGSRIAAIRKRDGVSQEQLAARLDVSTQWLSRLENGHENATIETLVRVANTLGVAVVALFQEAELRARRKRRSA